MGFFNDLANALKSIISAIGDKLFPKKPKDLSDKNLDRMSVISTDSYNIDYHKEPKVWVIILIKC